MLLTTFAEILSLAGSALDVTKKLAEFTFQRAEAIGGHLPPEEAHALERTLSEWEEILAFTDARVAHELPRIRRAGIAERAKIVYSLTNVYTPRFAASRDSAALTRRLHHSAVEVAPDNSLVVHLGRSPETGVLRTYEVIVRTGKSRGKEMELPTFNVTMLGPSGCGKTVFMASMYALLRSGKSGVAIRADDSTDLALNRTMENLYLNNTWPPGTDSNQLKYGFELLVRGKPVAHIDWVDYKGGALLEEPDSAGGRALAERLRISHSIIWMVDLTLLKGNITGLKAQLQTMVGRMASVSRNAVSGLDEPRAWLFVRTKSDTVRGVDDSADWNRAVDDLIRHLGPAAEIAESGTFSRAAALPVSSVGTVTGSGDAKKIEGDEPSFVEWPLLLSLSFLLDAELARLGYEQYKVINRQQAVRGGSAQQFLRHLLSIGPSNEELVLAQRMSAISQRLVSIHDVIRAVMRDCPPVVKPLWGRQ